jgi:hypothetical protein
MRIVRNSPRGHKFLKLGEEKKPARNNMPAIVMKHPTVPIYN